MGSLVLNGTQTPGLLRRFEIKIAQQVGYSVLRVAWGGIEPPTQGFLICSSRLIPLFNHLVPPPCENFVRKINMPFL
jgi:hypothetical protein